MLRRVPALAAVGGFRLNHRPMTRVDSPLLRRLRAKRDRLQANVDDLLIEVDDVERLIDAEDEKLNPPGPLTLAVQKHFNDLFFEQFNALPPLENFFGSDTPYERYRRNYVRTFESKK
jgi:hypothetical protein